VGWDLDECWVKRLVSRASSPMGGVLRRVGSVAKGNWVGCRTFPRWGGGGVLGVLDGLRLVGSPSALWWYGGLSV